MADSASNSDAGAVINPQANGAAQPGDENNELQGGQQQQQAQPNMWSVIKTLAVRMLFVYFLASIFRRSPTPSQPEGSSGPLMKPPSNLFQKGFIMDMYVYVSEQETFDDFNNSEALFWLQRQLEYGDWEAGPTKDGSFYKDGIISIPPSVQNNGSLYLHVYFVKSGNSPNPKDKGKYSKKSTAYRSKRLNKFKKRFFHNTVNLLTGQTDADPSLIKRENSSAFEVLSHWHPNLTINLLDDHSPWTQGHVPAPLDEYVDFLPGTNDYYPVVYLCDYWNLNRDYLPINDTVKALNLSLTFSPISLLRWQMYAAQGMRNKWYDMLGAGMAEDSEDDQDSLKTAFLETNPYLLALTIVVSILHSIFEFLAFKNDIQFWKSRKSLEGLSVRSVFFNVFQSLVVVLYVLDNETNFVVQISVCIGLVIEIWKIHKVVNVTLDRENPLFGVIPRPSIAHKSSYTESHTREYDAQAFQYLAWLLYPLLGCYAIYSLVYVEHKSWYSWVLSMLYGFLLTFGFIMMTPQLFINYKLKSVAHLPWRMLTYKALNTFIDDIFAFVIKMPTLYRIGCLRDDVIFFIYLYQRYIYRVDPKRLNEFGTSQEMLEQNGEVAGDGQRQVTEGESTESKPAIKSEEEKKKD